MPGGITRASSADVSGHGTVDLNPLVTAIQIATQQTAKIAYNISNYFPSEGALETRLGITSTYASTATLVAVGPGYLIDVSVIVASSGLNGVIYDSATTVVSSYVNAMTFIPSSAGFYNFPFPFVNGLVVAPSTASGAHVVSVSYRQ